MAINIYNKKNTVIDINSFDVLDFILKQNTIDYIGLEVIFNCDIKQILDKSYPVIIELINPTTSDVYLQFNSVTQTDFTTTKNTIANGSNTYSLAISYFNTHYINKNFFNTNNYGATMNSPQENNTMRLRVTVNGVQKVFVPTRTFAQFANLTASLSNTFNYLQTYNISARGYYFQNTDIVSVKLNNTDTAPMTVGTINNQANSPIRTNNYDFVYNSSAVASFAGSNSYALTKNYDFKTPQQTKLIVKKSPTDTERVLQSSNSFIQTTVIGCDKQFDKTLKNATAVTDTVNIEVPLLGGLYTNGLVLSSISVSASGNKVNFSTTPTITALGGAKWKIDMSYSPTGEANGASATYSATIELSFTHTSGNFILKASGFTYTNSTG